MVRECLEELLLQHDVLVIEGAGSPAEINLHASDIVNMRIARAACAATLLVTDIDRGGAFAHLYGTHQLLPATERALIRGFVLNRFRGDARLLAPGPQQLQELTGVPTLGVLPFWPGHGLPEEDGPVDGHDDDGSGPRIAIVSYPHISNLDEFAPLRRVPGVRLRWVRSAQPIAEADLVILPGSKHVASDLAWLRARGLAGPILERIREHRPTLALCGGLQMLGRALRDPHGVEGAAEGLDVLPLHTEYGPRKRCVRGRYTFNALQGCWQPLSGLSFDAYEIRHGATQALPQAREAPPMHAALADQVGWQFGSVLALYTHGLFENSTVMHALFGAHTATLEDTLNGLADFVEQHLGREPLLELLAPTPARAAARSDGVQRLPEGAAAVSGTHPG